MDLLPPPPLWGFFFFQQKLLKMLESVSVFIIAFYSNISILFLLPSFSWLPSSSQFAGYIYGTH